MRYQPQFLNTSSHWENQNLCNKITVLGLGSSPLPLRFPTTSTEMGEIPAGEESSCRSQPEIHTKQKEPAYKGQKKGYYNIHINKLYF